ncbi:hypothetical protein PV08_07080 [Exophiala spinifera]|uniref:Uncharacterized protein n=1 Tax=Exophiala spinifera TaxID=91928 RepID=A0A0D2B5U6_9EURO|nr:uncharacterized protein PV08_07080 [Exophiala spinifera]KIW14298.1 hypothetical protein PV08_07080 [Exophiala spinifera]
MESLLPPKEPPTNTGIEFSMFGSLVWTDNRQWPSTSENLRKDMAEAPEYPTPLEAFTLASLKPSSKPRSQYPRAVVPQRLEESPGRGTFSARALTLPPVVTLRGLTREDPIVVDDDGSDSDDGPTQGGSHRVEPTRSRDCQVGLIAPVVNGRSRNGLPPFNAKVDVTDSVNHPKPAPELTDVLARIAKDVSDSVLSHLEPVVNFLNQGSATEPQSEDNRPPPPATEASASGPQPQSDDDAPLDTNGDSPGHNRGIVQNEYPFIHNRGITQDEYSFAHNNGVIQSENSFIHNRGGTAFFSLSYTNTRIFCIGKTTGAMAKTKTTAPADHNNGNGLNHHRNHGNKSN